MKKSIFTLLKEPEGRVLLLGLALAFIYALFLALNTVFNPNFSQSVIGMTATHLLFGRAAAMSFGYTVGLKHIFVVTLNMFIESTVVMIFYPLFVFSLQKLLVINSLNNILQTIESMAKSNSDKVKKYGTIGLFAFVLFPFWMTGPIVGAAIGNLLGFSLIRNLTVVIGGTWLAILGWGWLLRGVHNKVAAFNPYVPVFLLLLIICTAIIANYLSKENNKKI